MFYASHQYNKKIFQLALIGVVLAVGWWVFNMNRFYVFNWKPYHVKSYLAGAQAWWGMLGRTEAAHPPARNAISIPVLTYHGILDGEDSDNMNIMAASEGVNVSLSTFRDHMLSLKRAGFETVTLDELYRFLRGELQLPEKSFVLTFDDGRRDSFYPADPILRALDYHAVMFVITKFMMEQNSRYYLTVDELKAMERGGRWEIQSHGRDGHEVYPIDAGGSRAHFLSNKLWRADAGRLETEEEFRERITRELVVSKAEVDEHFSAPVVGYAFPFGDYGYDSQNFPEAKTIVPRLASEAYPLLFYQTAFEGSRFRSNYSEHPDFTYFFVKRIAAHAAWSGDELVEVLEGVRGKTLPFRASFTQRDGWIPVWGNIALSDEGLVLRASREEAGSAAILDGTKHWVDYDMQARVQWKKGRSIYTYARFIDDFNFVGCNFGQNVWHIEQKLDGEQKVIKGIVPTSPYPLGEFEVGMRVQGRNVECLVNDQVILDTEFLAPALDHGGIGFKTWDPQPNNSEMTVTRLEVSEISSD